MPASNSPRTPRQPLARAPEAGTARKSIVWLASYPKSGNTWLRIFLANYIFDRKTPMPINQVHKLGLGDSIEKMYRMVAQRSARENLSGPLAAPFDIADHRQSLALRNRVLAGIVNNDADINFVKTHNDRSKAFGTELIPARLTRSAIYILRNPLDMVLSYARQYGQTPEDAAAAICRADNSVAGSNGSVTQFLGTWSNHARNWSRCREFPVLVLRYEDMKADPEAAFTRALEHIGVPPVAEKVSRAVRFSSFEELKAQEKTSGFIERSPNAARFFHSGGTGQWRDELAPETVARIRKDHAAAMQEFGYLEG